MWLSVFGNIRYVLSSCDQSMFMDWFLVSGSWTAYRKFISDPNLHKVAVQYLPVIPEPPDYGMIKAYFDISRDTTNNIWISHIFCHADKSVCESITFYLESRPLTYSHSINGRFSPVNDNVKNYLRKMDVWTTRMVLPMLK